ncbi:MAG: TonB-dependent receptor [Labilithrix sp.]|nr:TonB-dependent receptor [Labilithrix sp.]MCW5817043.1 TonB-dependent receptor [Labilithrix sp.]
MKRIAAVVLASVLVATTAHAQQPGVGGQPAKRAITKMPRLVRFVEAEYPPSKKAAGITASVVLTITIEATGNVTAVAVASSAGPDFDAAAVAAAQRFQFEPAEVDGKPAPAKITYRYDFVIEEVAPPVEEPPPPPPPEPEPPPPPPPAEKTEEVAVRGRPRDRRQTVDYSVRAEQARKVAGTQGDVLKVIQNLPGISRPPVASGQIIVWGSAPKDTRVYVDGVDIPALFHGSGLRGTVSSDLVASIDLVPGAFGAEYGRGLGGLVRVETRSLPRGTHATVAADTLDGSALISSEIGERVRVATAFRYGWIDRVFAAVPTDRDLGDTFPLPRYRDGQVKATFDLRRNEVLDTVLLFSNDDLARTVDSVDPAKRRVESTRSSFWRAYARYTSVSDRGDTVILTPFYGQDSNGLTQRFGGTPARQDSDADRYGLRAALRSPIAKQITLHTGLDALGTATTLRREGSLTLPPREGDLFVFGQPPGDEYAVDRWKAHVLDVGPYAFVDLRFGPVTLTPGARYDAYLIEGNKLRQPTGTNPPIGYSRLESAFAPRASARWDVTPRFALTAAYGRYHQAPEPEELSAVFGTPDLTLSKATHITIGESLRVTDRLSLDVVAFDKQLSDLVVRTRLQNPVASRLLTQNGEGRSYGVQLLLRQELWHGFFGWASYAISRSERRYEGDLTWRRFDFDQPHVLSIVGSQEIGRYSLGARFRYATGNPRTPVIGSVYDARNDRFDPVFGPQNTTRIPAFWQLDVRVDRSFDLGRGLRALVFVDLQNVTNQRNAEEIVYTSDFRRRDRIAGLPFIAVVGGRLEL